LDFPVRGYLLETAALEEACIFHVFDGSSDELGVPLAFFLAKKTMYGLSYGYGVRLLNPSENPLDYNQDDDLRDVVPRITARVLKQNLHELEYQRRGASYRNGVCRSGCALLTARR
jgi:hypothetical protein